MDDPELVDGGERLRLAVGQALHTPQADYKRKLPSPSHTFVQGIGKLIRELETRTSKRGGKGEETT